MLKESSMLKVHYFRSLPNLVTLTLILFGTAILIGVGFIVLFDLIFWNKDVGMIFFGSRIGEPITLGIGILLIHYLLVGIIFFGVGIGLFFKNRNSAKLSQKVNNYQNQRFMKKSVKNINKQKINPIKKNEKTKKIIREEKIIYGCDHHFGYLSTRPKNSEIPQECIICSRLGSCMVATVYLKKNKQSN